MGVDIFYETLPHHEEFVIPFVIRKVSNRMPISGQLTVYFKEAVSVRDFAVLEVQLIFPDGRREAVGVSAASIPLLQIAQGERPSNENKYFRTSMSGESVSGALIFRDLTVDGEIPQYVDLEIALRAVTYHGEFHDFVLKRRLGHRKSRRISLGVLELAADSRGSFTPVS